MSDIKFIPSGVTAPLGFTANGVHCGIRKNKEKKDLALIYSDVICNAAAVYTQNTVCGAPITVTKQNLSDNKAQAVICNSGIANTCSNDGIENAVKMCSLTASYLNINQNDVIVASTGVIGPSLPMSAIESGMPGLTAGLSMEGADAAAHAIMTTDTVKKEYAVEFNIEGKKCKIGGMAKGSGMINPNMATLLVFLTTDADISPEMLGSALNRSVKTSFNMLCIDGDTSTNDMACIMASGKAGNPVIAEQNEYYQIFVTALSQLCTALTRDLARDGEGATKLVTCTVTGAKDDSCAGKIAKSVISSSLVKTAMFGSDANWGRVLCAMGYSGASFDPGKVSLDFHSKAGSITVYKNGSAVPFDEDTAKQVLKEDEITIEISLGTGNGNACAFGCDLSYDYVKINGDYRT